MPFVYPDPILSVRCQREGYVSTVEVYPGRTYENVDLNGIYVLGGWFDTRQIGDAAKSPKALAYYASCLISEAMLIVARKGNADNG